MRPDPRVPLADVDRAATDVMRFTEGMDRRTYVDDARTQAAVERKFEIIGEALNRLRRNRRTNSPIALDCRLSQPPMVIQS